MSVLRNESDSKQLQLHVCLLMGFWKHNDPKPRALRPRTKAKLATIVSDGECDGEGRVWTRSCKGSRMGLQKPEPTIDASPVWDKRASQAPTSLEGDRGLQDQSWDLMYGGDQEKIPLMRKLLSLKQD